MTRSAFPDTSPTTATQFSTTHASCLLTGSSLTAKLFVAPRMQA